MRYRLLALFMMITLLAACVYQYPKITDKEYIAKSFITTLNLEEKYLRESKRPRNGLRTDRKIYAFSLLHNKREPKRYKKFRKAWEKAYPEIDIEKYSTAVSKRGFSLAFASFQIFQRAIADDVDYAIVLEDDAYPFPTSESFETVLNRTINKWPKDSPALFLGCHHIIGEKETKQIEAGIGKISFAYGSYAYMVRKKFFTLFLNFFEREIEKTMIGIDSLSIDKDWWNTILKKHQAYITLPLMIDHHSGFSATWQRMRNDSWAGKPEWWKIEYLP